MPNDVQRQIAKELTLSLTSLIVKPGPMPADPTDAANQLCKVYATILTQISAAG